MKSESFTTIDRCVWRQNMMNITTFATSIPPTYRMTSKYGGTGSHNSQLTVLLFKVIAVRCCHLCYMRDYTGHFIKHALTISLDRLDLVYQYLSINQRYFCWSWANCKEASCPGQFKAGHLGLGYFSNSCILTSQRIPLYRFHFIGTCDGGVQSRGPVARGCNSSHPSRKWPDPDFF